MAGNVPVHVPSAVGAPVPLALPTSYVPAAALAPLDAPTTAILAEMRDQVGVPDNWPQERAEGAAGVVRYGVNGTIEFRYTWLRPMAGVAPPAAMAAAFAAAPGGVLPGPVSEFAVALHHYSALEYTSITIRVPGFVWQAANMIEQTPLEDICRIVQQFVSRESRRNSSVGDLLRDHIQQQNQGRIMIENRSNMITLTSALFNMTDMWNSFNTFPPGDITWFLNQFARYWLQDDTPNSDGADELNDNDQIHIHLRMVGNPAANLRWRHTRLPAAAAAGAAAAVPPPPPMLPPPPGLRGFQSRVSKRARDYDEEGKFGGRVMTAEESAQRELVTRMRCIIRTEQDGDETCAAQTLVLARARDKLMVAEQKQLVDGKPEPQCRYEARVQAARAEWKEMINRRKTSGGVRIRFVTEARALHQRFLPLGQLASINDIKRMETHLETRLILYRWENERTNLQVEYAGNAYFARYGVGLVFGQHIDYVSDILTLMRKARKDTPFRLCLGCAEVVPVARRHECEGRCPHCTLTHENTETAEPASRIVCHHCARTLRPKCYEAHLRENVCNLTWLCTKCDRIVVRAREKPEDHICDMSKFCPHCCDQIEYGVPHECFMSALKPDKNMTDKIIVFDFETTQDNVERKHQVNMAVAMYMRPTHEAHYECFSSLDAFCSWLFQPKHKGYTAIAHNLRGYDGHFVLQWLDERGVWVYKPTYRGTSIMGFHTVEPYKINFIDSYNHIGVALREFPKVFGLDESAFKKGDYPYLFNTEANRHYRGPLPALQFFAEKQYTTPERWAELSRWHAAEVLKAREWDNAKELEDYCVNDVKLLREGLRHYQKEMYALAGVDPLRKLTIASQAMSSFRASFMKEKSVPMLSLHLQNLVREGYYGGFTEAFQPLRYFDAGEHGRAVDVCSMYPWAMFYNDFPVGHPQLLQGPELDLSKHRGFAKVTVTCPTKLLIPVLPSRGDNKLLFDLRGPKTGVWSTEEIKFAVERGYRVVHTEWVITWAEWSNTLFRRYIRVFFLLKTLASGTKLQHEEEKKAYLQRHFDALEMKVEDEAVKQVLDALCASAPEHPEERWKALISVWKENPTLKAIAKLMLNSLYGKFAESPYNTVEQTKGAAAFYQLMTDTSKIVLSVRVMKGDRAEINWKSVVPDAKTTMDKKHVCVPIAALITAYARMRLIRAMESIGPERVLYCDTDSVYYTEREGDPPVATSSTLGGLEDDLKGGKLVDFFVSTGPKAYGCRILKPDGSHTDKIRLKGFPAVNGTQDLLSRCFLLRAWQEADFKVEKSLRNFKKDRHTHEVVTVEMKRTFRNTFGKRTVLKSERNYRSVPLGYDLEAEENE